MDIGDAMVQPEIDGKRRHARFKNRRPTDHAEHEVLLQFSEIHTVGKLNRRHDLLLRRISRVLIEFQLLEGCGKLRRAHIQCITIQEDVRSHQLLVDGDMVSGIGRPIVPGVKSQLAVALPTPKAMHSGFEADAIHHGLVNLVERSHGSVEREHKRRRPKFLL